MIQDSIILDMIKVLIIVVAIWIGIIIAIDLFAFLVFLVYLGFCAILSILKGVIIYVQEKVNL